MKLDIRGEQCPMTYVKASIALHQMQKGDVLEVLVHGDEPLKNVPSALEKEGHKILYISEQEDNDLKITVEKG